MKKQTYWDCMNTGDDTTRKAYVKDGKQRVKLSRTITRDCATGITENEESEADDDSEADLVTEAPGEAPEQEAEPLNVSQLTLTGLRELIRSELMAWSTGKTKPVG